MHVPANEGALQAFDAMIHFTFEGSFLYLSTFGRTANSSVGPFAELCKLSRWHPTHAPCLRDTRLVGKEYARADARWGTADPTVVSLEILTVLGAGPLCCYILKQLAQDDPARHYWIVVLSTAELYGGCVPCAATGEHLLTGFGGPIGG